MRIRSILIALIIVNTVIFVSGSPVKFYSINAVFGISMREANSICKDNYGFIWASSKTGILRLTNDDHKFYHLPYETADANNVKVLYINSKLYAYTNNGQIFLFNPVYDRFDLVINLGTTLENKQLGILNLLIGDSGSLWIATTVGLYQFERGNLSFIDSVSERIYRMSWFDQHTIVLVSNKGIWLFDLQSMKKKQIYEMNAKSTLYFSTIYYDAAQGKLLIGTMATGLFCFDFSTKSFTEKLASELPRQPILAIEKNSDSTYLLGIDGQGIWELNKGCEQVKNIYKEDLDDATSLFGNGVYDLFCDDDKRVWICSFSRGVSYFDQASPVVNQLVHTTNNDNSLNNNDVNSVIEDQWGKLWFATNNGISNWDPATNCWNHFYHNKKKQVQVFMSLCEDNQGRIWAGSYSSGVYVLDGISGKEFGHYSKNEKETPTICNFILSITKDEQGNIWLGGVGGDIYCYQPGESKFRAYQREPISAFADYTDTQMLLGCSYGLSMLNKETGEIKKILLGLLIHDILVSGDEVWICTGGDGLLRYNNKTGEVEKFNMQSGLPSNFVNSIIYNDGLFWIGTENGLCSMNPVDKNVTTYTSIHSLSRNSFNRGSIYKLKNGHFAWGTNNGVVSFSPKSISEIPSKGRIFIDELTVSGRSIRDTAAFKLDVPVDSLDVVNLKYYQNTISLELLPIGISSCSKLSWKLEGFDKEWSLPSNNRIITYTNIPIGDFELKIKLYDNSLINVISERALSVRVIPPFWKKAWFVMLILIFISGIVFLALLYYINILKQKHAEEKVRFFTNTAHDIRTSLTLVKAPVEELIHEKNLSESGRNILKTAIEQSRKLTSVVTQLMDFQKVDIGKETISLLMADIVTLVVNRKLLYESFARSKSIELEFTSNKKNFSTAIDETKMEKVIDNLLSNAVKYSHPGGRVWIELLCENEKWVLKVKDQGIGISKKAQRKLFKEFYRGENAVNYRIVGSGIGLLLVKDYVNMHGGVIACESQENIGSTFIVSIPYKEIAEKTTPRNYIPEPNPHPDISKLIEPFEPVFGHNPSRMMNVLIVEDNDELRNFIADSIAGEFKIYVAEDGVKAWDLILRQLPDLVVTDVMMPNMDGFELCRLIKSTYETSHIPVILLSALSDKTEQLHGLGLGADDYLTKPFDMNLLIQKIKSIIHNREVVRDKSLKMLKENTGEPILANELNDKFVKKMLEVAFANISNAEFDKEDFASALNVSTSLLYKKIKTFTGQSPTDFIKSVRLKHASELLQTRQHTVTEVSEMCGFSSVGYFSTVFKKSFGKSPTEI